MRFPRSPAIPAELRAGEHRNRERSGTDEAEGEEDRGEATGERPQRDAAYGGVMVTLCLP